MKYPRYTVENNVDIEAECLYRYVRCAEDICNPHCHDFYEIFFIVSGSVMHTVNDVTQKLVEGNLVFIRPDDCHAFVYDEEVRAKSSYINLTFTRETAREMFAYLTNDFSSDELLSCDMPPIVMLTKSERKYLLSRISELNIINWQDKRALKMRMRVILADIFVRFFSRLPNVVSNDIPVWLSALVVEMERPENFIDGMDKMVELSKRSREHLTRCMKKYYGVSITEYINELRINYASNLLIHTYTPVLDVCFSSGFQSTSYFYKIFKAKYGISPTGFKKLYKIE